MHVNSRGWYLSAPDHRPMDAGRQAGRQAGPDPFRTNVLVYAHPEAMAPRRKEDAEMKIPSALSFLRGVIQGGIHTLVRFPSLRSASSLRNWGGSLP